MKKWIAFLLLLTMGMQLSACTQAMAAEDLMQGITANEVETLTPNAAFAAANAEFSLNLLQHSFDAEENVVLSPYSALMALAMTANGAQDTTLSQMEEAFGLPMETLNRHLAGLHPSDELQSANSLWIREGFPVEQNLRSCSLRSRPEQHKANHRCRGSQKKDRDPDPFLHTLCTSGILSCRNGSTKQHETQPEPYVPFAFFRLS